MFTEQESQSQVPKKMRRELCAFVAGCIVIGMLGTLLGGSKLSAPGDSGELTVRRLVIEPNRDGARVTIGEVADGNLRINLEDKQGRVRLAIGFSNSFGDPSIRMLDIAGRTRLSMGVNFGGGLGDYTEIESFASDGRPQFAVFGSCLTSSFQLFEGGKERVWLGSIAPEQHWARIKEISFEDMTPLTGAKFAPSTNGSLVIFNNKCEEVGVWP